MKNSRIQRLCYQKWKLKENSIYDDYHYLVNKSTKMFGIICLIQISLSLLHSFLLVSHVTSLKLHMYIKMNRNLVLRDIYIFLTFVTAENCSLVAWKFGNDWNVSSIFLNMRLCFCGLTGFPYG